MGRTVAVIWHVSFSIVAAGLFFFFVLPRWPELMGQTSPTLGLILRIVTGVLIGLAALPVVFTLQRTKRPELATPELALRLRTASISLHVLAAVLIVVTAVSEIWLSLDSFGPWLFGIYGAAAAIALLGIFAFYLAFVAELPPPPPKPVKTREKAERRGRKKADAEETAETDAEETEVEETEAEAEAEKADEDEASEEATEDEEPAGASLRNRRPSSKTGTKRRGRRARGDVATED
ncbi:hypothetical protein SAMN04488583_4315 [Mycobacterium sp. 88mf]|nr:hypothetical protein SAMN04488583_4315 [Mycobacterium sp. 88mf]SFF85325.1 hypothetical protein SAMN04488582_104349 [Mycobacterium sp. 455mf]